MNKQTRKLFIDLVDAMEFHRDEQLPCPWQEKEEREYQYVAIELLLNAKKNWETYFIQFFLGLVTRKSWWDSIDFIAIRLIGALPG
jgi:3-methyladenine DNA glycosylase AlkD